MVRKVLMILLIAGLMGVMIKGFNEKVKAEELSLENLINKIFNERVKLLSSKDLDEFDLRINESKNIFSSNFIFSISRMAHKFKF